MAAMMVAMAIPLFADAPPNAHNCRGTSGSTFAPEQQNHGQTGQAVSSEAQAGNLGQEVNGITTAIEANCGNNR